MGAFSAKFSMTLAAKLLTGLKKVWGWNDGTTTSIFMQKNLVEIERRTSWRRSESTECDVFHFLITVAGDFVALLQQEIASVLVGRFRCSLQCFSGTTSKPFPGKGTDLKIVASWRYDTCRNARKIVKIWENGCKVCAQHFDHLEARWKKVLPQPFTPCITDVHPYKNISLPRYRVPQKTVNL